MASLLRDRRFLLLLSLGVGLLFVVGFFTFRRASGCRHYMERAERLLAEGRTEDAIYAFRIFSGRMSGCPRADESLLRAGLLYAFSFKDRQKTREAFAELGGRFPASRYLPLARRIEAMYEAPHWEELINAFPRLDPLYGAVGLRPCSGVGDMLELLRQILPLIEPKVKDRAPFRFLQAKGAKCSGQWQRAQDLLEELVAQGNPHPAAVLELSDLFFRQGKPEASSKLVAALEKESDLPADIRPLVRFARAEHLRTAGKDEEALKAYLNLPLEDWPEVDLFGGLDPEWQAARLLRKRGDAAGALAHYRQVRLRLPPPEGVDATLVRRHNELRTETAELLLDLGRYQEAAETLRDIYLLPANHPAADSSARGLLMLSQVHRFQRAWRKTLDVLQKLQKLYPQGDHRPEMIYRLGQAQEALGRNVPPGFYREAAQSNDPIAVPAYYAHVRSKQRNLPGEPAPFAFVRIEEEIAAELGGHVLRILSASPPPGFNRDWLRADILYHRHEWEKAASVAAAASSRRAKESLKLSATRSAKPKTTSERLSRYRAAARLAQGGGNYPERAAFYVKAGRPDLLFDLARELSDKNPPLWRHHYFRHRRDGLAMALPPADLLLSTACTRREELKTWYQDARFSRLLFAAYALERMPVHRQELEKKSGLAVSPAEWRRFLQSYQPIFPGAASDLKEAHAQALATLEALLQLQQEALELCEVHDLTGMAVEEITQRLQQRLDEILQQMTTWLQEEPV